MSKHNMVLVIVDQLTKMAYLIPNTTKATDVQVADLFIQHIFCIHGIPETIVSNLLSFGHLYVYIIINNIGSN